MPNPNQLIDAVKTAKSIHDGDYSFLRDKSFVIRGNMKNNKGRGRHVKKHKSKYTLNGLGSRMDSLEERMDRLEERMDRFETKLDRIGDALFAFIKTANARFDTLTSDVNSLKQEVKDINARLDYNGLKQLPKNR